MLEAFQCTAQHDASSRSIRGASTAHGSWTACLGFEKVQDLRYGETPSQVAAFYANLFAAGVDASCMTQLHGKELSFNNILDMESALNLLREFEDRPTAVVIKHTNPCGIASADDIYDAFMVAYNVDPLAAFGCVIGLNRKCDVRPAEEIGKHFVEIVFAPEFEPEALEILKRKKNIRLMLTGGPIVHDDVPRFKYKFVKGGLLVQTVDNTVLDPATLKVATERSPTDEEIRTMMFAWKVVKHVWSNSVILAKGEQVVGIGAGQMSRVEPFIAAHKVGDKAKGSVDASDAFFLFRDGVDRPQGRRHRDHPARRVHPRRKVIRRRTARMAMVFTGSRVFRH